MLLLPGSDKCPGRACTCAPETCDAVLGLCRSGPIFSNPNLTAVPTTVPATEAWVIAVAVTVPAAVLVGVAVALVMVYVHRQNTAKYDRNANVALREGCMAALRTNT